MKKSLIISLTIFFLSTSKVLAEDCFSSLSGNQTVSPATSCTLLKYLDPDDAERYVSGVDTGTGTTNTAKITLTTGTMTINSNETLIIGTMEVTGGSVAVAEGAIVKVGNPMWMVDQDDDHYPANEYIHYSSQPTNGKRLNTLITLDTQDCEDNNPAVQGGGTAYYEDSDGDGYGSSDVSQSSCGSAPPGYVENGSDCNDTGTNSENVYVSATCYLDSDGDGYGVATTSYSCTDNATCASATWASNGNGTTASSTGALAPNNTDCYDSNANAKPGQTTCYTSHRGDGSFDYNCDSSSSGCNTCPASCPSGGSFMVKGCTGTCRYCVNVGWKTQKSNSGSAGCGVSGSYAGNNKKTSCTSGGCSCTASGSKATSCYSCTKSCK